MTAVAEFICGHLTSHCTLIPELIRGRLRLNAFRCLCGKHGSGGFRPFGSTLKKYRDDGKNGWC